MRISPPIVATFLTLALTSACHEETAPRAPTAAAPAGLEARRKQLKDIIAEHWEYTMRTQPEYASILGDKRYNDRWSDLSEKAIHDDLAESQKYVARLDRVDASGFPEQERLNKALLERSLKLDLEGAKFEGWLMPETQQWGPHLFLPQLVSLLSFTSVRIRLNA